MTGGLVIPTRGYIGTLNAVDVNTRAWSAKDWVTAYRAGAKKRRTNQVLDGAAGERGYPGDIGAVDPFDLHWLVIGDYTPDGDRNDDPEQGFQDNLDALIAAWYAPDGDENGCIPAEIVTPRNDLYIVGLQVEDYDFSGDWSEGELRLTVRIPSGPVIGRTPEPDSV